jgi:histidinol dehydrogenase
VDLPGPLGAGFAGIVEDLTAAAMISNALAPEHVALHTENADRLSDPGIIREDVATLARLEGRKATPGRPGTYSDS